MAVFSKIVVAVTAFAALTAARPLAIREVTSLVTETDYTTVEVPVTLWVDEHGNPLSTVAASATPVASSATTTATASAGPVAETSKIEMSASPSTPQVAPVVPTTTAAPQVQAYTPAPTPTSSPSPSITTPAAVATNNAQSGQTSGACEGSGNTCTGDITHWDGGLGACGWNVDTNNDMQIALPVGLMGSQSNGNPYCGRSLTIKNPNTGATVQATVGDKCMGCTGDSIDLTNKLFDTIGGGCDGRCSGFQWYFN